MVNQVVFVVIKREIVAHKYGVCVLLLGFILSEHYF